MKITVIGGGNSAHVAAGYLASKPSYTVNVLTRSPEKWGDTIKVTTKTSSWRQKGTFEGRLNKVSGEAGEVIPGSEVVLVCGPAHIHGLLLRSIAPHLSPETYVGTIFAQGGFDWIATDALGDRMANVKALFGLQNIPWICKMTTYGSEARILGPKDFLRAVSSPVTATSDVTALLTSMFDIPTLALPNFLCLTLTPSNQIIHPARYTAIFHDYTPGKTYTKEELVERSGMTLYEDFNARSAETLTKLDNELQCIKIALLRRFPQLDLTAITPIKERICTTYGSDVTDTSSLLSVMRTNVGYKGCGTPLKAESDGTFSPATGSRLFWEDVPYGLCILKHIAELCGDLPTPTINEMIFWHQSLMGKEFLLPSGKLNPLLMMETGCPGRYGLHRIEEVVAASIPTQMINYGVNVLPGSKL